MANPVTVRPLTTADVEDYRTIRLAALKTAPEAFGSVHAIEEAKSIGDHAKALAGALVLGAYAGDRIVGMVGLKREVGPKVSHKGFVWGFYLEPDHRRTGAGAALLSALLDAARGLFEQVILTVVDENAPAIALYERFGFTGYGLEPRALKSAAGYADERLMVRFIDDAAPESSPAL